MRLGAKNRLTAADKHKDLGAAVKPEMTALAKVLNNVDKIYMDLDDDHPKKELARRAVSRIEDAVADLNKLR